MLGDMRKWAASVVVKVFLGVLVLSFAVWGIGDIFRGGTGEAAVATVGGTEIRAQEVQNALRERIQQIEAQLGTSVDREQAARMGLIEQALNDVVARRLLDLGAAELGLRVPDGELRRQIVENPMFHGPAGFDRQRFQNILMASGFSEEGYIATLRQETLRGTLIDSVSATVEAPEALARQLYAFRNEQRRGHSLVVASAAIDDLPEPSEEELQAHLEASEERFTAPEFRGVTLLTLEPEDLIAEIEVDSGQIQAEYETRSRALRQPERRRLEQVLAPEREVAEEAADRLRAAAALAEVEAEVEGAAGDDLGLVAARDLPDELAEAAFALPEGGVSEPVESGFGWHVLRVVEIAPESVPPLEELEAELREELARREALDRLPALANALDDELAGGATIEEAAAALGLDASSVEAVDERGHDPQGQPVAAVAEREQLLQTAFETPLRETSLVLDTPDGSYFVLRVDDVMAPRLRSLEEVRDEVLAGWQAQERDARARARAEELLEKAKATEGLEELADGEQVVLRPIEPVARRASGYAQGLSPQAVEALFTAAPGSVAGNVVRVADGYAVIRAEEVIPVDPAADPAGLEQLRGRLTDEMRSDLLDQYEAALRRAFPVQINPRALGALL